ncbi:MAG: arginine repressor [Acidobacteriota bacterium]|nr:arginine repressor [Acidobacteriota bacterium]
MYKEKRQETILNLIRAKNIETQEELSEFLSKAGFSVTQSSVSRDLDELGIVKANGYYALPRAENRKNFGLISLDTAGENLVVAKCEPGLASAVAVQIDRAKITGIVGTIAGDDTIFIAVKDYREQKKAIKNIWELFE